MENGHVGSMNRATLVQWVPTFEGLPKDVCDIIRRSALHNSVDRDPAIARRALTNFALVNKSFHAFINNPQNMRALIIALAERVPYKNELDIAKHLRNMPGVQSAKLQAWLEQRKKEIPLEEKLTTNWNSRRTTAENRAELQRLLALGVNINARTKYNCDTALIRALNTQGDLEYIKALLAAGADIEIPLNPGGVTPLMRAASRSLSITQELLKHHPDINKRNVSGVTALMYAEDPLISQELLNAGASLNDQDNDGATALMWAAGNNPNVDVVKVLLKNNAKVNLQDKNGRTALIRTACREPHETSIAVIDELLKAHADVYLHDKDGKTALDYAISTYGAARENDTRIVKLLQEKMHCVKPKEC